MFAIFKRLKEREQRLDEAIERVVEAGHALQIERLKYARLHDKLNTLMRVCSHTSEDMAVIRRQLGKGDDWGKAFTARVEDHDFTKSLDAALDKVMK